MNTLPLSLFLTAIGLSTGSFFNAFVYRFETEKNPFIGRSKCPSCNHTLSWRDLIPVFSFCVLRGRCRYCSAPISWKYPVVEVATALAFVAPIVFITNYELRITNYNLITYYIFAILLMLIFSYDLWYMLIPDRISIPAIVIALFVQLFAHGFSLSSVLLYFISAVVAAGFFGAQFIISKGRWIGGGDMRLGFLIGLMIGWPMTVFSIAFGYILGSAITLPLVLFKKQGLKSQVPFGVFLTSSALITILFGERILEWYVRLLF